MRQHRIRGVHRAGRLIVIAAVAALSLPPASPLSAQSSRLARFAQPESVKFLPLSMIIEGKVKLPGPLGRTVTVSGRDLALEEVLSDIARQAGVGIAYRDDVSRSGTRVSLVLNGVSAADALAAAVRGTKWSVLISPAGQVLVVDSEKRVAGSLSGRVVERSSGEPVPSAQVEIEGLGLRGVAGSDGRFNIGGVPAGTHRLTVRRIGFEPQTVRVTVGEGATANVTVILARAPVSLSEVVVTATGEERRKSVANSIARIDSDQLDAAAVINTQQALAGSAAGITVLANSGQPGAGGSIRLRGVNSISQGNNPIIYLDGVRIFNGRTSTSVAARQSVSPLNDIDASDIERIEVVKGPAATTLYGTEASGGVIQIFTKRGQEGKALWTAEATGGFNSMGHVGPDSDPTGLFVNQCRGDNLVTGTGAVFEDPTCPSNGSWLKKGAIQRYALGVRGAAGGITYYVSGNFNDERSVLPTGGNRDAGLRANIGFNPSKQLELAINTSVVKRRVDWFPDGLSSNGALLNISRGPGSNFKGGGCSNDTVTCVLNDSLFSLESYTDTHHFISGGTATFRPTKKLTSRLAAGYDYTDADISTIVPFGYLRIPNGQLFQTLWGRTLTTVDLANTYETPIGASIVSTSSIGGQMFRSHSRSTDLQADNFAGPGEPTLTSGSLRQITDVNDLSVVNAGFFGQQTFGLGDRLFLTAGLRVDGNSAFGTDFGFQSYPKFSAAYVVSEESFWPARMIETMKLRAAVGESGKAPGAFDAVRTWSPIAAEGGQPAFTPAQLGNPDLGPERTREVELGFDALALDGRLGVEYTFYRQRTLDALVPVVGAPSNGFTQAQLENVGELYSSGNELTLTGKLIRAAAVDLSAALRFATFHSEAVDLGGQVLTIEANARTVVKEGLPVPAYVGKRVTNPTELAAPVIEADALLGSPFPTRIISPGVTLRLFNRMTVDALGEFQRGGHLLNAVGYVNAFSSTWQPCYAAQAAIRQAAAGDAAALAGIPALERARCTLTSADRDFSYWVEKSDFFKLRHVSVSLDAPFRIPGSRRTTIAIAGRNLWTSTSYTGTDPESADQRESTFSRRDYYVFPSARTFTATVRAEF